MLRTPLPSPDVPYDSESHLFIRSISTECPPCPPHTVTPCHPRSLVFPFVPFQSALLARPLLSVSFWFGSHRTGPMQRGLESGSLCRRSSRRPRPSADPAGPQFCHPFSWGRHWVAPCLGVLQ